MKKVEILLGWRYWKQRSLQNNYGCVEMIHRVKRLLAERRMINLCGKSIPAKAWEPTFVRSIEIVLLRQQNFWFTDDRFGDINLLAQLICEYQQVCSLQSDVGKPTSDFASIVKWHMNIIIRRKILILWQNMALHWRLCAHSIAMYGDLSVQLKTRNSI